MRVGIFGGTGFIGSHLAKKLSSRGDKIEIFSRQKTLPENLSAISGIKLITYDRINRVSLEGFDILINLAGEPIIGGRWTEERKKKLFSSRVDLTKEIVSELLQARNKPSLFLQGSAIGYYGFWENDSLRFTENSKPGTDFLAELCVRWEKESEPLGKAGIRTGIIRTGIVLSKKGGALAKMLPPFRMMLGGPIGSGKQTMSWIHIDDMTSGIIFLIDNKKISGTFNFTAPNPVSNEVFTRALADVLRRPAPFRVPDFALKLLFGEGSAVVSRGQNVFPEDLEKAGYRFRFRMIEDALGDLLRGGENRIDP